MSIQQSNLIAPKYGYDMVVAVTQKALNNTIKTYYSNVASSKTPFTEQICYFVKDGNGNAAAIDKTSLLAETSNIDPLTVTSSETSEINTLVNSPFYFAFQFTPGDPSGVNNFNYLTINPGTQSVIYWLLCTKVQIVFWNPDTKAWINLTQSRSNEFNINANINLQNIVDNTNLPAAVQAEVDNLGNTDVNVQQLVLDFASAAVNATTALPGLDPKSSVFKPVMQQFATSYFNAYAAVEVPKLNYAVTQQNTSSLVATAMDLYAGALVDGNGNPIITNPTIDQADLSTINYLFSVSGDALPAPAQFNWNWLEDNGANNPTPDLDPNADVNQYSGAIAIKRDAFAKYLISQLNPYVQQNCWAPFIDQGETDYGELDFTLGTLPADPFQPYNAEAVAMGMPDGLITYLYETHSNFPVVQGAGASDNMTVSCTFIFTIVVGNGTTTPIDTLTLNQTFCVKIDAFVTDTPYDPQQEYSGAPVNKTYTDVFTLIADDQGNISFTNAGSTVNDQSTNVNLPFDNDWDSTDSFIQQLAAKSFTEVPVTLPKQFVFPGGSAFTFKDAQFSNTSDLICHVTYLSES